MIPTLKARPPKPGPDLIPAPSVVLPQPYQVLLPPRFLGAAAAVCPAKGLFGVPLTDSREDSSLRAHEYAHLAIHRLQPQLDDLDSKVSNEWLQAGLDNIVNGFAAKCGVDIGGLPLPKQAPDWCDRKARAIHCLQALSFRKQKTFKGLSKPDIKLITRASKNLRYYGERSRIPNNVSEVDSGEIASLLAKLESYFGMPDATKSDRSDLTKMQTDESEILEPTTDIKWCPMIIETKPLTNKLNPRYLARKRVSGFIGGLRNPVRLLLPAFDGMGWAIKRKAAGGTVLIDQSGSMHLNSNDILKLLKDCPMATVAGYSGNAIVGKLSIYAQGGKYSADCHSFSSGNCVDGPALDWLAKQSGPRVWICDGHVTGYGDYQTPNLKLECINTCIEHSILRIGSMEDYFRLAGVK